MINGASSFLICRECIKNIDHSSNKKQENGLNFCESSIQSLCHKLAFCSISRHTIEYDKSRMRIRTQRNRKKGIGKEKADERERYSSEGEFLEE